MFKKSIFITLLTLTVLNLYSCKNSPENNNLEINTENALKNEDSIKSEINKVNDPNINQEKNFSFTISCGSGCAMIYNEQSRIANNSSYEIKFKVETYIDEDLSEEYDQIYIFECNSVGKAKSVHYKDSQENLLLNDNLLIKDDLIKIAATLCTQSDNNLENNKIKLTEENEPYKILTLPFDSKDFLYKRETVENKKYEASDYLIDYLMKKGYEGEKYNCYFLKSNGELTIIVSMFRADSEYFFLLKANQKGILSCDEIGSIGGEDTLYFKINSNLVITTYDLNNVEVKKYKV